ncbi:MAG: bifunctional [glutamine synthetase] adenylyltransferase/[glutamine synthetase]-adenylyl-L-tyrosine phosphorylase [Geminicoccaceae bacterium]|nr:bifunctional [glutamine synthetase] adenylyltransferase/[glutamine synthetase]-adenylyl-L-tyrosine phosphorylase [Geminicoccaceae bacterium]
MQQTQNRLRAPRPASNDVGGSDVLWRQIAGRHAEPKLRERIEKLADDDGATTLVGAIRDGSPFLAELIQSETSLVADFFEQGPQPLVERLLDAEELDPAADRSRLMAQLRKRRRHLALVVALADLGGRWDLAQVTRALTAMADLATATALDHLLLEAAKRGELDLSEGLGSSGVFVLGMGKHGAKELNYSSDIDLILLFDGQKIAYSGSEGPMACAVKITRNLVYMLEHKTRDGYVFRTDLRLRPHLPGHPLALSVDDAEIYFERHGQNWERAAFIKARVVAGDQQAGKGFLERIRPFIWRKHLDFAAIRDIQSIKRQINAYRGFATIAVRGHDLKVGRGGIREVEFFVQTQQLILGGRNPILRNPRTLVTLDALAEGKWIDGGAAEDLKGAYHLLRQLEHRLQMIEDKQTQALPARERELSRFARFAGFESIEALEGIVASTLRSVERHYAALFESEPDLGAGDRLVFTGTGDDPGTLETLRKMGFKDPAGVAKTIRGWHHGHIRATRSTRARELLTELMPSMLEAMQRQSDIDQAFKQFDSFVSSLPAGVQLFSLMRANPRLLVLLFDLMGAAPPLAQNLSNHIDLFDAMLAPDFFEPLPDAEILRAEFDTKLVDARNLEDRLDICRRWAHGRQFQAGLHVLLGLTDAERASAAHTVMAEVVVAALLPEAARWLAEQHGSIAGGTFAVIGMGKLGSRELTTNSDLDLVFIFDAPADARSDGERPLAAQTYYARLGQRLVSAIAARTAEGRLYEIDTRLRPSGNVGPVACALDNFRVYQAQTAQTWERQALTRARVIAGDGSLAEAIEKVILDALARERGPDRLADEIRRMRERIFKEHGSDEPWNLKHGRGGLVDIEFAAQYLQLRHLPRYPELRTTSTRAMLAGAAERGLADETVITDAIRALDLQHALQAVLRLSDVADPRKSPVGLREALVRAANRQLDLALPLGAFAALEAQLVDLQAAARRFFDQLCPPLDTENTQDAPS